MKRKDIRRRVGDRHSPGYMRNYMRSYRKKLKEQQSNPPQAANPYSSTGVKE